MEINLSEQVEQEEVKILSVECQKLSDLYYWCWFWTFTMEWILIFGFRDFARCARWIFQQCFGSGSRNVIWKSTSHTVQNP